VQDCNLLADLPVPSYECVHLVKKKEKKKKEAIFSHRKLNNLKLTNPSLPFFFGWGAN
jgi:hypothetical protein